MTRNNFSVHIDDVEDAALLILMMKIKTTVNMMKSNQKAVKRMGKQRLQNKEKVPDAAMSRRCHRHEWQHDDCQYFVVI